MGVDSSVRRFLALPQKGFGYFQQVYNQSLRVSLNMEISTLLECQHQHCKKPFQPTNKRQRFCCAKCRAAAAYLPTKLFNDKRRLERRRAISMGFDGRYGGPRNIQGIPAKPAKKRSLRNESIDGSN